MYNFEKFPVYPSYPRISDEELFSLAKAIPRLLRLISELRNYPALYYTRLPVFSVRYCLRGRNKLAIGEMLELWEQGVIRDGDWFYYSGNGNRISSSLKGLNLLDGSRKTIEVSPSALGAVGCSAWGCKGERTVFPPYKTSVIADFSELVSFAFGSSVPEDDGTIPEVQPPFTKKLDASGGVSAAPLLDFVRVPAGEFLMGFTRNPAEFARQPFEGVQVQVDEFELMRTPVTLEMWQLITRELEISPGETMLPVNHVNWHECNAFARLLSSLDDRYTYRLPTEAEWEYACRADGDTEFYWGDNPQENPAGERSADLLPGSVSMGIPNGWGLVDMGRVVSEWCSSPFNPVYPNHFSRKGWTGDGYRVVKGGVNPRGRQFQTAWSGCLVPWLATGWQYGTGFRLVRELKLESRSPVKGGTSDE